MKAQVYTGKTPSPFRIGPSLAYPLPLMLSSSSAIPPYVAQICIFSKATSRLQPRVEFSDMRASA
jgi:hypothetical protein